MQLFARRSLILFTAVCLSACSHGDGGAASGKPAIVPSAPRHTETFTGEVVKRSGEYFFKLRTEPQPEVGAKPEPEQIFRLSRSKDANEFASDEIHLRKYYGKTIVVKGQRVQDWIAKADIVGQWLKPGEARGSTQVGPEPR